MTDSIKNLRNRMNSVIAHVNEAIGEEKTDGGREQSAQNWHKFMATLNKTIQKFINESFMEMMESEIQGLQALDRDIAQEPDPEKRAQQYREFRDEILNDPEFITTVGIPFPAGYGVTIGNFFALQSVKSLIQTCSHLNVYMTFGDMETQVAVSEETLENEEFLNCFMTGGVFLAFKPGRNFPEILLDLVNNIPPFETRLHEIPGEGQKPKTETDPITPDDMPPTPKLRLVPSSS